jgi:hypothetical protein
VGTGMTRGPYTLATKGMDESEAREWWNAQSNRQSAKGHGEDDLGPALKYPVKSYDMGRNRKDKVSVDDDGCAYYHPAKVHGGKSREVAETEEGDWMGERFVFGGDV